MPVSRKVSIAESAGASDLAAQLRGSLAALRRRLREQGARQDLTPSQVTVLLRLEKDGAATVSDLARAEGMRPQSMSSVVTPLQDAGLLQSAADPDDARKTRLSLSKRCVKLLERSRAAKQDWLTAAILEKLSPLEQAKVSAALKLLARLTDGPSA